MGISQKRSDAPLRPQDARLFPHQIKDNTKESPTVASKFPFLLTSVFEVSVKGRKASKVRS